MADSISFKITDPVDINKAIDWMDINTTKALNAGPVVVTLGREKRNNEQNKKAWAMWTDISKQVKWYEQSLLPDEWKMMLTSIIKNQKTVPGIEGGFVVLSYPSSKLTKNEFCDLIELTYAFGAERGVKWSEPALEAYEYYKEMSQ